MLQQFRNILLVLVSWSVCALAAPSLGVAAVRGVVYSLSGVPIVGAEVVAAGQSIRTDSSGQFEFSDLDPPIQVQVSHPRFSPQAADVPVGESRAEIVLPAKQEVFEEIAVSARRGDGFAPASVAVDVLRPQEAGVPSRNLTELVAEVPGVAENGQGGMFQTYSIRGIARQRVMTLVSGMRITGERRAGVSASFLDPRLIGKVDVVRGPSSTFWGSGALGGVVQMFPRDYDGLQVELGLESQGQESSMAIGWGDERSDIGFARRHAIGSETPGGDELFSGFTQTSGLARRVWSAESGLEYEFLAIGSVATDIEKANTQFPERATTYPRETHLLLRFGVERPGDWAFETWAHPNDLETRVVEAGVEEGELKNEALDFGIDFQLQSSLAGGVTARYGFDLVSRRNVDSLEITRDLTGASIPAVVVDQALDGGTEDEGGVYGSFEWSTGRARFLAGGRLAWQRQSNADAAATEESAVTGFAGVVVPLAGGFEWIANAGTGLRFPSLSERFFSGTTGRGSVVGNPDLGAERSLSLDTGLRWYGDSAFVAAHLFRNDISDYIERIEVAPDELAFVNLTEGSLEGLELEGFVQLDAAWRLSFGGHRLEGRDTSGAPLSDVPADRVFAGLRHERGRWRAEARLEARSRKIDPGSGEKPIPAVELLSASLRREFADGLALTLAGRNLLDREYFNSADRRVPPAPGRSIGISLSWTRTP